MKIKREDVPSMTLEQFADTYSLVMEVRERRRSEGDPARYYAHFEHCEIVGGGFLRGEFGNGATTEEAIADYAAAISLKRIVIGAYTPERREIDVPRLVPNTKLSSGTPSAQVACSASKHAAMKRDGWKNCWHCEVELIVKPNKTVHGSSEAKRKEIP